MGCQQTREAVNLIDSFLSLTLGLLPSLVESGRGSRAYKRDFRVLLSFLCAVIDSRYFSYGTYIQVKREVDCRGEEVERPTPHLTLILATMRENPLPDYSLVPP